jgi:hypothetical protein
MLIVLEIHGCLQITPKHFAVQQSDQHSNFRGLENDGNTELGIGTSRRGRQSSILALLYHDHAAPPCLFHETTHFKATRPDRTFDIGSLSFFLPKHFFAHLGVPSGRGCDQANFWCQNAAGQQKKLCHKIGFIK